MRRLATGVVWALFAVVPGMAGAAPPADGGKGVNADVFDPLAGISDALGSPVVISAIIEPGAAGQPDTLAVTATLEEGVLTLRIDLNPKK